MNKLELTFENMKLNGANVGGLHKDDLDLFPYEELSDIAYDNDIGTIYVSTSEVYETPSFSSNYKICNYYFDVILELKRNEYREIENDEIIFVFGFTKDEMQKIARDTGKKVFGVAVK